MMSLMDLGLVRGLVGQVLGTLAGMAIVMAIRIAAGMEAWSTEPVWVAGMIVGAMGFLIGVGGFTDWSKWWVGKETPFVHGPQPGKPAWARYFDVDYNHKIIGIQYAVTGLLMGDGGKDGLNLSSTTSVSPTCE